MKVNIEKEKIEVITKIEIDGNDYPIHNWNLEKAQKYCETGDEKYLKELKDFSLEL